MKRVRIILAVIAVGFFTACSTESVQEIDETYSTEATVKFYPNVNVNIVSEQGNLIHYTNERRELLGLQPLELDTIIQKYTDSHTEQMISKGAISHDNWNARAESLLNETGGYGAGENVQKASDTHTRNVFLNWLDSEPHRKAIENPDFTHIAVTVKLGEFGTKYYTQIFVAKK